MSRHKGSERDRVRRSEQTRRTLERQRERENQESLDFMQWVRRAAPYELEAQLRYTPAGTWQSVAVEREVARRNQTCR